MKPPGRRLTPEEAQVWAQVARTVKPLLPPRIDQANHAQRIGGGAPSISATPAPVLPPAKRVKGRVPPPLVAKPVPVRPKPPSTAPLDGSWDKRIAKGTLLPDFSLDLHGATLDQAYVRLMHGLTQAKAMGARVVLIVTGKPRPVDAADRGTARGAIRAKVSDWLGASDHASDIVAIRGAHRRHGGQGAIYVVLRKRR